MATYFVRKGGSDSSSGLTEALAKLTIASAITASTTDDIIDIGPGTFTENLNGNSRTYQGAGMFLTFIDGNLTASGDVNVYRMTVRPINAETVPATSDYVFEDVYFNGINYGPTAPRWFYNTSGTFGTSVWNRCIIANFNPNAKEDIYFNNDGLTASVTNCVFYNMYRVYFNKGTINLQNNLFHTMNSTTVFSSVSLTHNYNAYYIYGGRTSYVAGANDVELTGDPCIDVSGGDYRPASGSAIINAGNPAYV